MNEPTEAERMSRFAQHDSPFKEGEVWRDKNGDLHRLVRKNLNGTECLGWERVS